MGEVSNTEEYNQIKIWQNVIATLCTEAPNTTIRDCLRAYDTTKPTKDIKRILNYF